MTRAPRAGWRCRRFAGRTVCSSKSSSSVAGGLSRSSASLIMTLHTSMRKPATPAVAPEAHDLVELAAHVLVPPVEVRLLGQVVVQVVLAGGVVERPGRAAEAAHPVVRRRPVRPRVGPHVPVAVADVARRPGVDEPGVLVAGVVGHQVHEDPDAPPARPRRPGGRSPPACRTRARRRSSPTRRSPSRALGERVTGDSQTPSTPSQARWSRCAMIPGRSPTPSPLESANERG